MLTRALKYARFHFYLIHRHVNRSTIVRKTIILSNKCSILMNFSVFRNRATIEVSRVKKKGMIDTVSRYDSPDCYEKAFANKLKHK